ncbi:hypothetical protein H6P81_001136 [Aristolochia fimbriata]|uniref:NAD-dependent epimerase/dehydratase domain-containing protein n=1 Tax=Aristolochia fimbriata TaxID=158543 RepID=A0AAV7F6L5_ARIFI|nr:hypothetical protein H6P81_001136 [Aristolochia fimbriata]
MEKKGRVCVTGAGGYLGSSLVKLLLSRGYFVHGTVRDPSSEKYAHLKKLEYGSENLQLFKAELLDYGSLCAAVAGCDGVFHVASPCPPSTVPNPEIELIEPAVTGTLNVLKASSEAKVKRVIVVSSVAAVIMAPHWSKDKIMDETCWSDKDYCRTSGNWYCLSKTAAESEALEYGKKSGLEVVTVCPSQVLGPMLQPTMNASSLILFKILTGVYERLENKTRYIVDVRDVAEALLLTYERSDASGRYICTAHPIRTRDLIEKLRRMFPQYKYPPVSEDATNDVQMSAERLKSLGWNCRPLEETLVDTVKSFEEAGLLKTD